MMRRRLAAASVLATALALGACAGQPVTNASVQTERARLARDQQEPNAGQYAQTALTQAQQSLAAADQAAQSGDSNQLNHQIFLTDRALGTAEAQISAGTARSQMSALNQQRDQTVLRAREAQLAQAQRELQAYKTKETSQGTVVTLYDLPFALGKATLSPGAANRLQPLASYLKEHPDRQITIEGNTDSTGSREANASLSQARAEAVMDYLVQSGVPANRIIAKGLGEDYPVASNDSAAGRQENRRVDVVIQPPPSTASLPPETPTDSNAMH